MARVQASNRQQVGDMSHSLSFNGSQRIVLTTMGDLGSALMGAFSYGLWIRTSSKLTTVQYYLGTSNSAGGNYFLCGITRNSSNVGKINFQIRDHSGHSLGVQIDGMKVNDGEWHHIVGTKDNSNLVTGMKMYIDGLPKTLTTISNVQLTDCIDFNRAMAIGSGLGTGAITTAWVGKLSRPYFYKRQLTDAEVLAWYLDRKPPTGEFAGYENTEGAGTAVADTQGVHNGTLTADTQWVSADTPYKSRPQRQL